MAEGMISCEAVMAGLPQKHLGELMKTINVVKAGLIAASLVASATLYAAAPTLTTEVVVSKLDSPWDMSFLKDGTMFFTEKC